MEAIELHHTPITDQEVARRQRRVRNKRWLALAIMISGSVVAGIGYKLLTAYGYADVAISDIPAPGRVWTAVCMMYFAIAVLCPAGWLLLSFGLSDSGPEPAEDRFDRLSLAQMEQLKTLCDEDPQVKQIVANWLSAECVLRVRDLRALLHFHAYIAAAAKRRADADERERIIESLKKEATPKRGEAA